MLRGTQGRTFAYGAAVASALVALTACGSAAPSRAPATPIPIASAWHAGLFVDGYGPKGLGPATTSAGSASPSATGTASASPTDPTQLALAGLGIATSDFATGYSVHLVANGDTLSAPSIDFCGAEYPSEAHRVGRRLVVLSDSTNTDLGVFTEAVAYDTVAHATAALDELRTKITTCAPHTMTTADGQDVLIDSRPVDGVNLAGMLPQAQRAVESEMRMNTSTGLSSLTQTVWQMKGPYLVALTFAHAADSAFTSADQKKFTSLGGLVAQRLTDSTTS